MRAPDHSVSTRPPQVLLAEGDAVSLTHLQNLLRRIGYDVHAVHDGREALEVLESESPPILAVLDWVMPGVSGLEICRRLQKKSDHPESYIILLTAWSQRSDRVEGLEAGANDCLFKPVDVRELRIRLQVGAQIMLERRLRESEERFRSAFECAGIGMAVVKTSGEFVQVNRALTEFLGHTSDELLQMNLHQVSHPGDSPSSYALLQQFLDGGQTSKESERRFVTKAGIPAWAGVTLSVALNDEHRPTSIVVQAQDIRARKQTEEALQQSIAATQQTMKELADQKFALDQHAIVAATDVRGNITYANDKFCAISGYTREELLGQNHRLLNSRHHPVEFFREMYATISAGKVWHGEIRNCAKNGSIYWVHTTIVPLLGADGKPRQYMAIRTDVTERKLGEEALRHSEGLLRAISENAEDLILVCDANFKCLHASSSFLPTLGFAAEELMGQDARSIVHPNDIAIVEQEAAQIAGDGQPRALTLRYRHKNYKFRYVEANFALLRNAGGAAQGYVVVSRVVDDRLLAEQKLQAAYAETELFLQSIPSIVIGLDGEGRIIRWNRTAANTFGLEDGQVRQRKIDDCGIQWLHPEMRAEIGRWLATESSYACEELSYEREGKTRFLNLMVRRIPNDAHESAGFIVTGADVTKGKNLEGQLRQAQKLEAIGQLAAGIAHEINTPTQYVGDNTRFLKDSWGSCAAFISCCGTLEKEARAGSVSPETLRQFVQSYEDAEFDYLLKEIPRAIDQSLEGLGRVAKIVHGMKEFSHPGSEEKRAVNINKAIETTITVARHEWKYCAEVVTAFDETLPLIPCLVGEFNQVMLNLIINATHAIAGAIGEDSPEKGTITIRTRRNGPWAEISIADTGGGIPDEIRTRIYEPFFTTKAVGKGTGQGLALAHSVVVNRHQGKIWFETEVGRGTTFFVCLPLDTGVAVT